VQNKTFESLNTLAKEVVNIKYFALLITADMDTDTSGTEPMPHEEALPSETCRSSH
jgi:hypothetical protein